jgi:hypothetical protein
MNWFLLQLRKEGATLTLQSLLRDTMGPYLTHAEGPTRARALELIATVLERLPSLPVAESVAASLVTFACERLNDFPSVPFCLQALRALLKNQTPAVLADFPSAAPPTPQATSPAASVSGLEFIATSLFGSSESGNGNGEEDKVGGGVVHWPACPQATRQTLYRLIGELVETAVSAAAVAAASAATTTATATSSTAGKKKGTVVFPAAFAARLFPPFLEAFEGEKDPRALLQGLRTANGLQRAMATQTQTATQTATTAAKSSKSLSEKLVLPDGRSYCEALCSLLSMYFPVTFTPPPNDPYHITQVQKPP